MTVSRTSSKAYQTPLLLPQNCLIFSYANLIWALFDLVHEQLIKLQTIVFIRDKNARGQEISGYIDFAHRLKTEDFEQYFSGKKRLLPKPSDLR